MKRSTKALVAIALLAACHGGAWALMLGPTKSAFYDGRAHPVMCFLWHFLNVPLVAVLSHLPAKIIEAISGSGTVWLVVGVNSLLFAMAVVVPVVLRRASRSIERTGQNTPSEGTR